MTIQNTSDTPNKKKVNVNLGHLLTGGISGAISRTATSPLERLRILQQTASAEYIGLGTIGSFRYMREREGIIGFFKGNGMTVMKIAPFSAFEFYFYEVFKNNLYGHKKQLGYFDKLISGGLTGIVASTLTYPFDIVKTYLTINVDNSKKLSMIQQTNQIIKQHGIMGLYKGWGISMAGIAPFIGIKMSSYDMLMQYCGPAKDSKINIVYYNLIMGALAGTIAVTGTYPLDLVRKLLQLNGSEGHNYKNLRDCCGQLYKREGFSGFFKGLWATYLKVAPMTAILFLTNEWLKRLIKI